MAFKFSPENFEIVHIFNCILGIAMSCELNNGMTLVTPRARVLRQLNTLNVTEWAKPLQWSLEEITYLSDVALRYLIQHLNEATYIDFVIEVFFRVGGAGAAQGACTLSTTSIDFLFVFSSCGGSVFLCLRCLDHNSLPHELGA
jgi:hypothetical protein